MIIPSPFGRVKCALIRRPRGKRLYLIAAIVRDKPVMYRMRVATPISALGGDSAYVVSCRFTPPISNRKEGTE